MKPETLKSLCVSGFVLIASATAAQAEVDNRDVVHDLRGNVVVNSFGNCVRTQWVGANDECGAGAPAVVAKRTRTSLAQEDRTIYFDFNKSTLTADAHQRLNSLATVLKSASDVKEAHIVGYADRIGSTSYNEKLSKKRAESVRNYLVSRGYLNSSVAETRWLGETVPKTYCPDSLTRSALIECLQKDRRVEVEIEYLPEAGQKTTR
jgi:outer membrane protein OmpA-like peptidoglycan-associated protein